MGIGSVASWNRTSGMQMTATGSTDSKSKSIQNEITDVQQEIKKLSSKEEYSVSEKAIEQKKLQHEKASLDTELKLHQEELLKSQKREVMMAKLQEERETSTDEEDRKELSADGQQADRQGTVITENNDGTVILKEEKIQDEKTSADAADETKENIDTDLAADTGLSHREMHAMVSADNSIQRADRQGVVIARIRDGIAIFKGEMNQDKSHGVDTDKKQAELEKMEKKEQKARAFQFSALGEANSTMRLAAKTKVSGEKDRAKVNTERNTIKLFEEDQARQQRFQISFG
ncbi:MAG: hypothetical protein NC307_11595 [Roseburia sp.]|nr:hypothetical protein [Roseburia sp.]